MPKRSAREILDDIESSDVDDEIDRVLAMTPEERRKELVAAGFTEKELDAKADALRERMQQAAAQRGKDKVVERAREASRRPDAAPRRGRVWMWVAAAVAAVAGGLIYATLHEGTPPAPGPSPPTNTSGPAPSVAPDLIAAADLRRRARLAYSQGHADDCLVLLDEARAKDPAGDTQPDVVDLRQQAARQLQLQPENPPKLK